MAARKKFAKKKATKKKATRKKATKKKTGKKKATRAKAPKAKKGKGVKGSKGGRPRFKYDQDVLIAVGRLAQSGNSVADAARIIGVSRPTLERVIADEGHPVSVLWKDGQANMRNGLRSAQMKRAMGGNATMLIWLGKQELNQRDYKQLEVIGRGPGGAIPIAGEGGEYIELFTMKLGEFLRSRRTVEVELPDTGS